MTVQGKVYDCKNMQKWVLSDVDCVCVSFIWNKITVKNSCLSSEELSSELFMSGSHDTKSCRVIKKTEEEAL